MKKQWISVLILTLLLTACTAQGGEEPAPSRSVQPVEAEPSSQLTVAQADYEIQRLDRSVLEADGAAALEYWYDLVQLTGDRPENEAVNQAIEADSEAFFSANGGLEALEEYIQHKPSGNMSYVDCANATITQNDNGWFSVCMTTEWYMGGVYNTNLYGMTYNLNTGAAVKLTDLVKEEPEALSERLHTIVKDYMASQPEAGWWEDAEQTVDQRPLEEMIFWVDEGEIVLSFYTYELTFGAYGPVIIPTGIMVEAA